MWAVEPLPSVQVQVCDDNPGHVSVDIWRTGNRGLNLGPMTPAQVELLIGALREAVVVATTSRAQPRSFSVVPSVYQVFENGQRRRVTIENTRHGEDVWAIRDEFRDVWTRDGQWEWEPMPSSRDDDFMKRSRWTFAEATAELEKAIAT